MPETRRQAGQGDFWLGLIAGNTRLHWALFGENELRGVWHTPHLTAEQTINLTRQQFSSLAWRSLVPSQSLPLDRLQSIDAACSNMSHPVSLYCASVVPAQTALWQDYPNLRVVTLSDVPIADCYPTLGIDRALNLWGAGDRVGWPAIVIDAGTALTLTAGDEGRFIGGAILPGLQTQFSTLANQTATLPALEPGSGLPVRWARDTPAAIRSGIVYSILATMRDFVATWQQQHPKSKAVLTGGDGAQLYQWWIHLEGSAPIGLEPNLAFWGLQHLRHRDLGNF